MKKYSSVCALLLTMLVLITIVPSIVFAAQNAEDIPLSYAYDETSAENVTVTVTISNDGIPVLGSDDNQTPMAHLEVEIPYFDLAEYGLEEYYRYGTDGGSGAYSNDNLIERPTVLHMLIYLTERYYLGLPEEQCGISNEVSRVMDYQEEKDVLYIDGEVAYTSTLAAFSPSGSATSLYINGGFWGHDENLMYYRNHRYPLMAEGWGATADYILLSDGDDFDLAMFTNWEFYHSGNFLSFGKENYMGQPGTTLTVTAYATRTSAVDVDGKTETKVVVCEEDLNLHLYNEEWTLVDAEVTNHGDGTYDITLPKETGTYYAMLSDTQAATDLASKAPGTAMISVVDADESKKEDIFVDVLPESYYYDAVYWAVEEGITKGLDNTHFGPTDTCTRAQAVTFLWRAAGKPEPKTTENPFADVKADQYYYKAVLWAVEQGITSGKSNTEFAPDDVVTRDQAVAFLWRFKGKPEPKTTKNPFTDVKEGQYYYKAVLWAVENKITAGKTVVSFGPTDPCDRSQIVTFLYRAK